MIHKYFQQNPDHPPLDLLNETELRVFNALTLEKQSLGKLDRTSGFGSVSFVYTGERLEEKGYIIISA